MMNNLRMPTGNEAGANTEGYPGGKLPNGYLETIINQILAGQYIESTINIIR
ncbi:hypothetical protein FACS189429_7440 [Bacteroidia bacterium]|nr:hypothetical protein FACS189429_7440 [Bacteroidia bacterium]